MYKFGLTVLLSLFLSASAFAGDHILVFKKGTALPIGLQSAIEGKFFKHCDYIWTRGWEVEELKTSQRLEPIDQTPTLEIYETTFAIRGFDNDGMHPFTAAMHVTAELDNPFSATQLNYRIKIDAKDYCQYNSNR